MKRLDAKTQVRGEAAFVDDMPRSEPMLYAAITGSTVAHGKLLSIDPKQALAMAGVKAVLTAADIPGKNCWGTILADQPFLADDLVEYWGQPVAVVVATSTAIARRAAQHIHLQIEALPAMIDPREAFLRGQIIGTPHTFVMGDVDRVWQDCDYVVEATCNIGGQEHLYLETQRSRATPLEGNTMRLDSATQNPFGTQRTVAQILGWPCHGIEVDVKRLGGGFGGKEEQASLWAGLVALAAWKLQQPVELVLSRLDDMLMTGKRHPYSSDFKIGFTRGGEILAYAVQHYQNAGAYADLSTAVLERTLFHSTNAYFIPHVRIFGVCCRTNIPPNTALRGFGGPQAMFVIESAIAKVAETLNVPREEIQAKNLLRRGQHFPYGQAFANDELQESWHDLEQTYHVAQLRDRIHRFNHKNFAKKKGYAIMPICFGISFTTTFLNQASALVHVYGDGSVSVSTGGVEMGQGLNTKLAAIAAKTFGIQPHRIKLETTNTTRIANMSPSAASVTTDLNGNAMILAIQHILDRLKRLVAQTLKIGQPDQITLVNEDFCLNGQPLGLSWDEVIHQACLTRTDLSAHAFYTTPDVDFDRGQEQGHPFAYHVCGAALLEVTLDCLRGVYSIDAVQIIHQLGRSLNPDVDLGQVEGGLAQGLGWMTLEDLQFRHWFRYVGMLKALCVLG
ncbi:molybdopterin cofactor-binding domain-containing protein [Lyngbya confervoides]|uniref:Molybdopterin-dependent oxidoreductase n=1 Tax=Lyngbya confervoides BDU141951 TaxID=1574623 RepID=A0ABD4SZR3_9CYAN|nr:molybdopterin cofactor-binding domain-containing protein [Lyngbya confervoides]MCM1981552.1 molybdopterin-dependent oxidoreductase [Lyngbya confervoides BDU141951]